MIQQKKKKKKIVTIACVGVLGLRAHYPCIYWA